MSVCVCTLMAPEQLDGFYSYSIFMSLTIIGRCSVNVNILTSKTEAFHSDPQRQNCNFLENDCNGLIKFHHL
jgi:hypothetical protein